MFQKCSYLLLVICFACLTSVSFSQDTKALPDTSTSDGLFQAARSAAFDNKNYPQAKIYCKKALEISPNYADIKIFLGRIYTWTSEYDSAKTLFESVLATNPTYTDASVAFADLLYWNDHYKEVIAVCDAGLKYDTGSNDLLLRKAKALASLKDYAAAAAITAAILKKDNNNAAARSLESRIKDESIKNKIGVSYDYNV